MSNYRDDREALRQRNESLEAQVAEKEREIERIRGSEDAQQRIERLESDLAAAQVALTGLRHDVGPRPARAALALPIAVGGVALLMVVGGGVFAMMSLGRARSSPPAITLPVPVSTPPDEALVTRPTATPTAAPAPAPVITKRATATFTGKVTKVSGRSFGVGAPCSVDTDLSSDGSSIRVAGVRVKCGGTKIYDSSDSLNGMSMYSAGVRQVRGTARDTARFTVAWDDKGERTGERSQASLDTTKKVGTVFSTTAPPFQVEFSLDSRSVADAEPLLPLADSATCRTLKVPVLVKSATGSPEARVGETCSLEFGPGKLARECRLRVACGASVIYGWGTSGYIQLGADLTRFVDDKPSAADSDPQLSWKVGETSLVVKDEGMQPFEITLEVPKGTDPLEKP